MESPPRSQASQHAAAFARVVHELKTPIQIIGGFAELIEQRWDQQDREALREMVGIVRRNAARLDRLVEDLLRDATLDAEMFPISVADTDVFAVVCAAADAGIARGVPVRIECSRPLRIRTDGGRVEQILGTLVDNACRYGAPPVVLTGHAVVGGVRLSVRDAGPGVAIDDVPALFDPFSRVSSGRNGSNGLGLCTARRIARLLDGELDYVADGGQWSFVVTLADVRGADLTTAHGEPNEPVGACC